MCHVRLPPDSDRNADMPGCRLGANRVTTASQRIAAKRSLFDHIVGEGEQRWRHGEAERLRGKEVDSEIELGRLFDREVGRFRSAQNFVDLFAGASK